VSGWRASAHVIIYCVYVSENTWTASRPPADRPTPPVGIVKTLRPSLPLNEDIASVSDRKPFPELHEIFMLLRGNKRQRQTQHAHCNTPPWLPHCCPYRAREIVKFLWRLCLAKHINGGGGDQRQTHFRPERPLPAINIYLYAPHTHTHRTRTGKQ